MVSPWGWSVSQLSLERYHVYFAIELTHLRGEFTYVGLAYTAGNAPGIDLVNCIGFPKRTD